MPNARVGGQLVVLSGMERGRVLPLPLGSAVLGRGDRCELRLSDPTLSSRHCRFDVGESGVDLVDLGSSNGTRVNGVPVSQRRLSNGDALLVGGVRLDFRVAQEPASDDEISAILHQLMASRDPSGTAFPSIRARDSSRPGELSDHEALELLFQTGRIACGPQGPDETIRAVLELVRRGLRADRVLFAPAPGTRFSTIVVPAEDAPRAALPLPETAAARLRDGETIILALSGGTVVSAPVQVADERIGSLLAELRSSRPLDGRLAEVLSAVADVLASALQRSRQEEERREFQARLAQQENLALIGLLSSGIAHDLGNVLSCLVSYAELATVRPDRLEALPEYVQRISRKGLETVRTMLATARRPQERGGRFDLRDVVADVAELVATELSRRRIAIARDAEPAPCIVEGNPGEIQDLLLNLCLNASEAMSDGGTIRLACRAEEGGRVRLAVTDEGAGIPADKVPLLFTPFQTTKDRAERRGTGLGLYRVKSIADSHGAEVKVDSRPGHGTTFEVHFPASGPVLGS